MNLLEPGSEGIRVEGPVGLLGGSFDPPHVGHLLMARDAIEHGGVGRVIFVPAARSPLKGAEMSAGPEHRVAMLRSVTEGHAGLSILDWELERGGTSYTVDTVKRFIAAFPDAEPHWILGADQFAQLGDWRSIGELAGLTGFLVMARDGAPQTPSDLPEGIRLRFLPPRRIDVSSTEVRERSAQGLPLEPFVPAAVADYIRRNGLYGWQAC